MSRKFFKVPLLRNRYFFFLDIIFLLAIPTVALALRLDGFHAIVPYLDGLITYTLITTFISVFLFYRFELYKRYWRYASIDELVQITMAVTTSAIVSLLLFFSWRLIVSSFPENTVALGRYINGFAELPRSLPFIAALLKLFAVGGSRFSYRLTDRFGQSQKTGSHLHAVLIMGAGDAGAMIVRELQKTPNLDLVPIGFLDDDQEKLGIQIYGVPVLGDRTRIPEIVQKYRVKQVIIAMPTASGKTIRDIVNICESVQVQTKIIPGIYELLDGTVRVNQLRDVDIEDLLRREPVNTDIAAVREFIKGQRVLITGAGGSIGSELARQVFRCGPADLVLLDHTENSIFEIHNELLKIGKQNQSGGNGYLANGIADLMDLAVEYPKLFPVIADIRFLDQLECLFEKYQPELVFHAAAHKHVPLMETNPAEAITNNILGTQNVIRAAIDNGVNNFVMISTDKAVNPTNIMGASKRVAELLVHQAARETGRPYVAVRFGNVLGSSGSVVLTFKKQIASGGPVTVTHPEMRRFFMTIPEAVQLVLQAATLGIGDEVFVLDMGEPVKIVDLARDLIELSGLEIGRDIDIVFTSPRPGEKFYEELFISGETYDRTRHEKIFISKKTSKLVDENLETNLGFLRSAAEREDRLGILTALRRIVPEFQHSDLIGLIE